MATSRTKKTVKDPCPNCGKELNQRLDTETGGMRIRVRCTDPECTYLRFDFAMDKPKSTEVAANPYMRKQYGERATVPTD